MDDAERARQARARRILVDVVGKPGVDPSALQLTLMSSLTNRNYKITLDGVGYVIRIPGEGTDEYIDRASDEDCARITSEIGVNAPLVHYDRGVQITRFVDNSQSMREPGLLDDPAAIGRAALAFHRLHTSGRVFRTRFDEKLVAQSYKDLLKEKNARLPDGYDEVQRQAEVIREALAKSSQGLAPCHNDPAPENLVDTGERAYILDWEFGGNNDPFWDLGDFSVEAGFTRAQDNVLLAAYLGHAPRQHEYGRMVLQKSLVFLLWTLYGVLQHVNENPSKAYHFASFWDYAMDRFTRCQAIMNDPEFPQLVAAVRYTG